MLQECLAGARVLDLSQYIPGPFATLLLADFGADVVKIEPPRGDPMRYFEPRDADGVSPLYKVVNRNKTVVRLDLKDPEGREAFTALVRKADVLLESFRPGVLERLGFGSDRLRALNPGLVHCALSGFGQTGPYRLRAGHDITYMGMAGVLAANGPAEGPPMMPFPPVADHASALHAVNAILAALVRKGRTGKGAYLDVSIFETALHLNYQVLTFGRDGGFGRESDLLNGGAACYRAYRCRDGRFAALGAIEAKFWQGFCEAVGKPEWTARQGDPLPQTGLIREVEALFATRPLAEWQAILDPVDCCFEAVANPQEVPSHPHVTARGLLSVSEHDGAADIRFPAFVDGASPPPRRPHRDAAVTDVMRAWARD